MFSLIRLTLSVLLLLGTFVFVLSRADWNAFMAAAAGLSPSAVVLAAALMLGGALLASWRLQKIAQDLGYRLSFRDAVSALSVGQLAGSVFFQLAGQLIARSALLSRRLVPVSGTIIITGYERFSALVVSLLMAAVGAAYLFGRIHLDLAEGGTTLLKVVVGIFVVLTAGAALAWGHLFANFLPLVTRENILRFARSLVLSLLIQLATMAGYFVLAKAVSPETPAASLAAASALVMLAASLPISLAGWGVREMSAVFALGAIGLTAQASLTVAVVVGILSLAVVGVLALSAIDHRSRRPAGAATAGGTAAINYSALLDYGLPIAAATAVFFQIYVPVNKGVINVNLADPVVILGGALFVIHHFGRKWPAWRLSNFTNHIFAATGVMLLAYLHGLASFGWSDWAFANKLIGWFVLLGYGATGALIVNHAGVRGLQVLLRTFVVTAVAVVVIELVLFVAFRSGADFLRPVVSFPFLGFSQNRNAFGFQLLLAVCILFVVRWPGQSAFLAFVFAGIWYTGSRSIFLALPVVVAASAFFRSLSWRALIVGAILALQIVLLAAVIPAFVNGIASLLAGESIGGMDKILDILVALSGGESDNGRLRSGRDGLEMFLHNPVFGAGLGAFVQQQLQQGKLLVIHSVPLWLMAETGLFGFAVIVSPLMRTFLTEMRRRTNDVAGALLILMILGFAVVSNLHDIMYQRAFWLLLGAAIAVAPKVVRTRSAKPA